MKKTLTAAFVISTLYFSSYGYADTPKIEQKLIRFTAEWCGPCQKMDKIYKDKDVSIQLGRYMSYNEYDVDTDKGENLAKKYKIQYLPALLITDKDGKSIKVAYGEMSKQELIDFLKEKHTTTSTGGRTEVLFGGAVNISGILNWVGGLIRWIFQ